MSEEQAKELLELLRQIAKDLAALRRVQESTTATCLTHPVD